MSHTKGIWCYEPGDTGDSSVGIGPTPPFISVDSGDGGDFFPVCTLDEPWRRGSLEIEQADEYNDGTEANGDIESNARLICAAPKMYALLLELRERLSGESWHTVIHIDTMETVGDAINKVISVAEKGE